MTNGVFTMPEPDPRPTLEAPDDDPYLWLEEIDGERALAWVEAQNAATLARFGDARLATDRDTLTAIYDRPDNIPLIARRGTRVFNFWKDAAHPRGLWRATTLDSYRSAEPEWDILLDLDALAAKEGEDWIWSGAVTIPGAHDRAMLRLARGGAGLILTGNEVGNDVRAASALQEFEEIGCTATRHGVGPRPANKSIVAGAAHHVGRA